MSDSDEEDNSVLGRLRRDVEAEGIAPDSPRFIKRFNQMKVIQCRQMRGHSNCLECLYYDECELVKQVMRDNRGILITDPDEEA